MDLSLDSGWAPAKAFLVQAVLSSFILAKGGAFFPYFFLHSKFINSRLPLFPFIKYNEATEQSVALSVSSGTKSCFMASIKEGRQGRQNLELHGTRWAAARGGRDASKQPRRLPFTFILMANLLSRVLRWMIRARCFFWEVQTSGFAWCALSLWQPILRTMAAQIVKCVGTQ